MQAKTVIVTGASRGLGAAAARLMGEMGANVVLNARSSNALQSVADGINAAGGDTVVVAGDIGQPETAQRLVATALDTFRGLDAIVNNAATLDPIAPISEGNPQAWRTSLLVNMLGPVALTQAALPYLRERQGRVINVSSGAAVKVTQGWGAYCTTKAALNHFTRVLAEEEPQIVAIALRPGAIDTAMQATIREKGAQGMTPDQHTRYVRHHEAGDLLPPELPGRALAVLALHAPHEWSGEFIHWNDERVEALVARHW